MHLWIEMVKSRINRVTLIVGGRGSGKTDFVKNLIHPLNKRRIICDTFDSPVWRNYKTFKHPERESEIIHSINFDQVKEQKNGTFKLISSDTDQIFETIEKDAWNSLIVIEDATRFIEKKLSNDVKKMVLDTKQKNTDLIFIFHTLSSVPPDLIRYSDFLTLFKTKENWSPYFSTKFPIQQIEKAFHKVREMPEYSQLTVNIGS